MPSPASITSVRDDQGNSAGKEIQEMLSLQLIIILGLLFGLLVCCMVATQFAPGHLAINEDQAADWPKQTITTK